MSVGGQGDKGLDRCRRGDAQCGAETLSGAALAPNPWFASWVSDAPVGRATSPPVIGRVWIACWTCASLVDIAPSVSSIDSVVFVEGSEAVEGLSPGESWGVAPGFGSEVESRINGGGGALCAAPRCSGGGDLET